MNQVYLEWKIIVISRFKIIQMKNTLYIGFDLYGNAGLWDKKLPYSLEFAQIKAPPPPPPVSLEVWALCIHKFK